MTEPSLADDEPSLADDETALAQYAGVLADAIEQALPAWFDRCVARYLPETSWRDASAERAVSDTAAAVRDLLARDIDEQSIAPLELLRRSVRFPTETLRAAGAPPAARDDFAERSFPDDIYDLTPASFGDVHESLHEPGLVWGAAKAHVHLRRRREQQAPPAPTTNTTATTVLCTDLMDRSKISAAFPHATFVRTVDALVDKATAESLVLVDLARIDDIDLLHDIPGRIIAFGSHVDEAALAAAATAGAEALPRSVFFKRLTTGSTF